MGTNPTDSTAKTTWVVAWPAVTAARAALFLVLGLSALWLSTHTSGPAVLMALVGLLLIGVAIVAVLRASAFVRSGEARSALGGSWMPVPDVDMVRVNSSGRYPGSVLVVDQPTGEKPLIFCPPSQFVGDTQRHRRAMALTLQRVAAALTSSKRG